MSSVTFQALLVNCDQGPDWTGRKFSLVAAEGEGGGRRGQWGVWPCTQVTFVVVGELCTLMVVVVTQTYRLDKKTVQKHTGACDESEWSLRPMDCASASVSAGSSSRETRVKITRSYYCCNL